MTAIRRVSAPRGAVLPPVFDGYPYLVTRIGRSALRHLAVLPGDWPRDRLIDLACRQAETNQLETCVCFGPEDAVYVVPGREPGAATHVPTGIAVVDRLVVGPVPESLELAQRRDALREFARRSPASGYIVGDGLGDGRPATAEDIARLRAGDDALPSGLRRCETCGAARGEALRDRGNATLVPRVVDVSCRCDNHNRCAGCGEPLADRRLSAWYWDEDASGAWYVAAYIGLGHSCARAGARA